MSQPTSFADALAAERAERRHMTMMSRSSPVERRARQIRSTAVDLARGLRYLESITTSGQRLEFRRCVGAAEMTIRTLDSQIDFESRFQRPYA